MTFYLDRGDLDRKERRRAYRVEAEMALSALDCAIDGGRAAYVSSELTTGRRYYALLAEVGARKPSELKAKLGRAGYRRRLFDPNCRAAGEFARRVEARVAGGTVVVNPAPFAAPGWTQPEYLAFWEKLLRTRVAEVHFNRGWPYSNGCVFEFLVTRDQGLPAYDADGRPLDVEQGAAAVAAAVERLSAEGFEPRILRRHLARLRAF